MRRLLPALTLLLLAFGPALATAQDDAFHQRAARAHSLAHRAADAWATAADDGPEALRRELLAFAGASELAASALSDHDTPDREASRLLGDLEELARGVQGAFDRNRTGTELRDDWAETRRALVALTDPSAPPAGGDGSGSSTPAPAPSSGEPTSRLEPPPADPDAPRAVISETRWSGTFTPDLVVNGRLEGRGLRTGALVIRDSGGREVHRAEEEIRQAIAAATAGNPADALATAVFSVRIDDDHLAAGENTLVLTATDSRGRTTESTQAITKRLF